MKPDSCGLVVRVFVCVSVYVGVCSFVSLFADSRLSLFPWLVGWLVGCLGVWYMCACVCSALAHFRALLALLETFFVFFLHFGGPCQMSSIEAHS